MANQIKSWTGFFDRNGVPIHIDTKGNIINTWHEIIEDEEGRVVSYVTELGTLSPGEYLSRQYVNAVERGTGNFVYTGIDGTGRFTDFRRLDSKV